MPLTLTLALLWALMRALGRHVPLLRQDGCSLSCAVRGGASLSLGDCFKSPEVHTCLPVSPMQSQGQALPCTDCLPPEQSPAPPLELVAEPLLDHMGLDAGEQVAPKTRSGAATCREWLLTGTSSGQSWGCRGFSVASSPVAAFVGRELGKTACSGVQCAGW